MLHHALKPRKHSSLGTLYLLNFLLAAHGALIVFFNASFLASKGISESWLGSIYIAGSLFSICIYLILPKLLKRFGVYKLLFMVAFIEMLIFFGLGFGNNVLFILGLFIVSLGIYTPLSYGLDILLESQTNDESQTGNGRSSVLTMTNTAYVIAPFLAGMIIKSAGFSTLYSLAAFMIVPFLYLLHRTFKDFKDPAYHTFKIRTALAQLKENVDLRSIFIIQFLLRFFFAWMVIYMPLYLHQHIGFSLSTIGLILSVMLIPFVLLEYPLGHYADKRYGEKEFLILGFSIMALATYYLSFITTADLALWMLVLFITRIGAATVEVMNEIYFFKHVDSTDTDTISAFRIMKPLAYIIAPITASMLFFFVSIQYLFGVLGIIMLIGILVSVQLRDTK